MSKIVEMRDFVEKTLKPGSATVQYYPCSQKVVEKVSKKYNDSNIKLETLVASVDDSITGNCRKGLFITTYGIYISLHLTKPRFINFGDINNIKIGSKKELIFNLIDGRKMIIYDIDIQFNAINVYSIITNLKDICNKYEKECPYKKSKIVKKGKESEYNRGYEEGFMDSEKIYDDKFDSLKEYFNKQLEEKENDIREISKKLLLEKYKNENLKEELSTKIKEYNELKMQLENIERVL